MNQPSWKAGIAFTMGILGIALLTVLVFLGACAYSTSKDSIMFVEYDLASMTIAAQAQASDICVVGRVVGEDPARWNSPDGEKWSPPEDEATPIVYTTYYIEPAEILLGSPSWGAPIAFRGIGGTLADGSVFRVEPWSSSMSVGQEVIVFGRAESYYGPEAVYVPAEAYWLTGSIWIRQTDAFLIQGHAQNEDERSLTLDQFRAKLAAATAQE